MAIHPAWLREKDRKQRRNPRPSNPEAKAVADAYVEWAGFPPIQPTPYIEVNPETAIAIAAYFDLTPSRPRDPKVRAAYGQLIREIEAQFSLLPIAVTPYGDRDPIPYRTSRDMMEDVRRNRHLYVYTGGTDHDLLTRTQNWKFRAIHDYFGHAMNGFEFGPRGEENAWISHSKMFSPLARAAMTTETRGQNNWVNAGPYSHLPPQERPFAEQKAILLPKKFRTHPVLKRAYVRFPGRFGF